MKVTVRSLPKFATAISPLKMNPSRNTGILKDKLCKRENILLEINILLEVAAVRLDMKKILKYHRCVIYANRPKETVVNWTETLDSNKLERNKAILNLI